MIQKIRMRQVRLNTITRSKRVPMFTFLIVISCLLGCNTSDSFEETEYINHPFDIHSLVDKSESDQDYYVSQKLDSLLKIEDGHYFFPDVNGTSFRNYYVEVVSCITHEKVLLLFYDSKEVLRDTIAISSKEVFSLDATLSEDRRGVCIGTYDEKLNQMTISDVYAIDESIKLSKVSDIDATVVKCLLPQEYLSEENPLLEETFSFGSKSSMKYRRNDLEEYSLNIDSE